MNTDLKTITRILECGNALHDWQLDEAVKALNLVRNCPLSLQTLCDTMFDDYCGDDSCYTYEEKMQRFIQDMKDVMDKLYQYGLVTVDGIFYKGV